MHSFLFESDIYPNISWRIQLKVDYNLQTVSMNLHLMVLQLFHLIMFCFLINVSLHILQGDGDKTGTNDEDRYKICVFCGQMLGAKDVPKLLECLHVTCNACIATKFSEIDRNSSPIVHCTVSFVHKYFIVAIPTVIKLN